MSEFEQEAVGLLSSIAEKLDAIESHLSWVQLNSFDLDELKSMLTKILPSER